MHDGRNIPTLLPSIMSFISAFHSLPNWAIVALSLAEHAALGILLHGGHVDWVFAQLTGMSVNPAESWKWSNAALITNSGALTKGRIVWEVKHLHGSAWYRATHR
jgi:hypothetical protein